jgi:hypothetical protein
VEASLLPSVVMTLESSLGVKIFLYFFQLQLIRMQILGAALILAGLFVAKF